jgi:signal transduction histidine kinase
MQSTRACGADRLLFARMRPVPHPLADDAAAGRELRLEIASARAAIPRAVERILNAVEPVGLPSERMEDLAVAVSEALSNAAIHGNRLRPGSRVIVAVIVIPRVRAVIEVKDEGPGFDHDGVGDPTEGPRLLCCRRRLTCTPRLSQEVGVPLRPRRAT